MAGPLERVAELCEIFGTARACAAELLCDRHSAQAVAFTVVEPDLTRRDVTFGELREASARLAQGLADLGVGTGDRVATLMGKSADLVISVLAIWRLGAVHVPLFTAFAPAAIAARTAGGGTRVVICDPGQQGKLAEIPGAKWRVVVAGSPEFGALLASPPMDTRVAVGGQGTLIELFTSGTTGAAKSVPIPLRAVASMCSYQEFGLNHTPQDVFWNAADPGWAYGLYYAIVAPLALGRRSMLLRGPFSTELTWAVLATFGVTNFAAAPTVYRALRNSSPAEPPKLQLRHCSSAGEPLNTDVISWAQDTLGVAVHDQYGQTELGMAVGNAWHPAVRGPLKPGSMGRALPGWSVEVLHPDIDKPAAVDQPGRLAVELAGSPCMWFSGYRDAPERTAQRFTADGRWYLTGDIASKDSDGYLYFSARDDDVVLTAGYRIGPFEVESALLTHPDVTEAAVVGQPDALRGEVLVAFVVPRADTTGSPDFASELQQVVKSNFSAHAYPRQVYFTDALPKTPSGKLQRYLLRDQLRHAG